MRLPEVLVVDLQVSGEDLQPERGSAAAGVQAFRGEAP